MATKPKNPEFTSPRGVFRFPKLTEPDYGTKEYPKPDGEYKVTLILSQEEAEAFIAKLQPLHDEAVKVGREAFKELKVEARKKLKEITIQPFFSEEYDKETEEPTGNLLFTFKMAASGISKKTGKKWSRRPALFDAKGKPILKAPDIWGGSEGRVQFEVSPYFIPGTALTGIKLRLNAVKLLELRSGGARSASDYGFDEEEDGFSAADLPETEDSSNPFADDDKTDGDEADSSDF